MTDSWDRPWPPEQDRETIERVERVDHDLETAHRVRRDDVRWLVAEHRRMRLTILRLRVERNAEQSRFHHLLAVLHPPFLARMRARADHVGGCGFVAEPCPWCGKPALRTLLSDGDTWDCPWCLYEYSSW